MAKKIIVFFLFLVLLSLTASSYVSAQQKPAIDISISPFVFDYTNDPGSVIKDKIRVRNNASVPMPLRIDLKKLIANANGQISLKDVTPQQDETLTWFKFDTPKFVARPQEWTDVSFTLSVPKDAAFGYYWAITINQDTSIGDTNNNASITGAAAIPVLLNVRREGAIADGRIDTFKAENKINEYLPVTFDTAIENTGNVHIKPHGNIFINNGAKDIAILDINNTEGRILPQSKRTFTAVWDDGFLVREPIMLDQNTPKVDKNGKPETKLTIHWNKITSIRFGHYTAHLFMVFDNGQRDVTLESTTTFWVIPYTIIGLTIGGLLVVIFGTRFLLKLYVKRAIRKQSPKVY